MSRSHSFHAHAVSQGRQSCGDWGGGGPELPQVSHRQTLTNSLLMNKLPTNNRKHPVLTIYCLEVTVDNDDDQLYLNFKHTNLFTAAHQQPLWP